MPAMLTLSRRLACAVLLGALALPAPVQAGESPDEILLKNGSRILGTITGGRDGSVTVETDFAGKIKVDTGRIESILSTRPAVVLLANETVIRDQPLQVREEQLLSDTGSYTLDQLRVVNPEPWELGEGYRWTGLASFSFAVQRGNSDTDELDYKLETAWRSRQDRYTLKANGEIDEAAGERNAENWKITGKYDYFVSKSRYRGINAFVEADEFTDLNLRYLVGPYVGREFYTDPLFALSAEIGASYVKEKFMVAPNDDYAAANWNLGITSNYLGGNSRLYLDQQGIWNLDETSDLIVNTTFGLAFPLLWNIEAAAEVKLEYDSGAVDDVEELDETYNLRVGYTW